MHFLPEVHMFATSCMILCQWLRQWSGLWDGLYPFPHSPWDDALEAIALTRTHYPFDLMPKS